MSIELHSGSHCHVTSKYFKCCCLLAAAHQTGRVEEPATLPETPPSAAGRKSGVEQKAGREGARHEDQLTFRAHAFAVFFLWEIVLLLF